MAKQKYGPLRQVINAVVLVVFAVLLFVALLIAGFRLIDHLYPGGLP